MITCGLDMSTSSSGWSIFDGNDLITYGVIKPKSDNWRDKIEQEYIILNGIINKYKPEKIFMEDIPAKPGALTLIKLGAVQGMVLALSAQHNIEIQFLSPSDWRSPLGLYDGTREGTHREVLKKKAIEMVNKVFNMSLLWVAPKSKRNQDDEAEAILIAYSQVKKRRFGKPKA